MNDKFEKFLNDLKTEENASLIESARAGWAAIRPAANVIIQNSPNFVEDRFNPTIISTGSSYLNPRDDVRFDPLMMSNQRAAEECGNLGNGVLHFLQNSAREYNHLYTSDSDEEYADISVDDMNTSNFRQYKYKPKQDKLEEEMGLTATEWSF